MQIASGDRRARVAIAVAAAVLLVAGAVAALTHDGSGHKTSLHAGEATTTSSSTTLSTDLLPAAVSTTTTAPPVTVPTTTTHTVAPRPTTVSTRAASPAVSGTTQPTHEDYGPRPPDAVNFPYEPGKSEWVYETRGLRMVLDVSPAKPRPGEPVHFTLHATDDTLNCCGFVLDFGDGDTFEYQNGWSCPQGGPPPGTFSTETDHTYATGNPKEFLFYTTTESCASPNVSQTIYRLRRRCPAVVRASPPV